MTIEPTSTMPWIEFAPDISGVWSVAGHLRDHREAAQDREDEDGQRGEQLRGSCLGLRRCEQLLHGVAPNLAARG